MSTRLSIRQTIAEETGLGVLGTLSGTHSTTRLQDNTARLTGPFTPQRFPVRSPIRMTSGDEADEDSYVQEYAPATGTLTILPALTGSPANTETFEVWAPEVEHVDRVDEAINRALDLWADRWINVPLTLVTDGDMEAGDASNWTASSSAVSKVNLAFPVDLGRQELFVNNSGANGRAASASMRCVADDVWYLDVLVRAASGTAELIARDVTNSADITLDGPASTTTEQAYTHLENTFVIPTDCEELQVWLTGQGATDDTYWTHIIAYPLNQRRFVLPTRITDDQRIGDVLLRLGDRVEDFRFGRWALDGNIASVERESVLTVVQLSSAVTGRALYIEELAPFPTVTADATDVRAADRLILPLAKYELWKNIYYRIPSDVHRLKVVDAKRELDSARRNHGAKEKMVRR